MNDIRYYRGKVKINLLGLYGKKAMIESLEFGILGPKDLQKFTYPGEKNITLIRHCWRKKK